MGPLLDETCQPWWMDSVGDLCAQAAELKLEHKEPNENWLLDWQGWLTGVYAAMEKCPTECHMYRERIFSIALKWASWENDGRSRACRRMQRGVPCVTSTKRIPISSYNIAAERFRSFVERCSHLSSHTNTKSVGMSVDRATEAS